MKKNKLALILALVLLVTCLAVALTACNDSKFEMKFVMKGIYEDSTRVTSISLYAKAGEEITPPTPQEIEGKTFKGWYTDENCEGDTVTPPTIMPNKNSTYYGIYVAKAPITVTFVVDGQTIDTITQTAGSAITPPTAPDIDNKTFLGWKFNNEGTPSIPSVMPDESGTYYADYADDQSGNIQIPSDYNMVLNEKGGENKLYLRGLDVYLEDGSKVFKSKLSDDGSTADFTIDETDYCAFIDYSSKTYNIYSYAIDKTAYIMYLPFTDTFNFERMLYFNDANSTFKLMGYTYDTNWANGTYAPVDDTDNEFNIKVTEDYTYKLFTDCRIKLIKRARQSEDMGTVAYSAFVVYEEALLGEYKHYSNDTTLSLDGYGFATSKTKDGKTFKGACETSDLQFGQNTYINYIDLETKETSILQLEKGSTNIYAPIGNEIGLYTLYSIEDNDFDYYYLLMNGWGNCAVFFGEDVDEVATGTYSKLDNGEFEYTMTEVLDENLANGVYNSTFRFKLTSFISGINEINAFIIYNEKLAGSMANESGTETLILDGYNGGTHTKNGQSFTGTVSTLDENIIALFSSDDEFRIFRIIRGDENDKFVQIGNEYGVYYNYSYVTGYHDFYLRFNGEGGVQRFEFDENTENYVQVGQSGTYLATDVEDEFSVTFGNQTIKVALRLINFGSIYEPNWRYVHIEFDESMFGSFANASHNETLVLDGYGLEGVYTDASGKVYSGIFAREWNIVTMSTTEVDEDGNTIQLVFKVLNNTFEYKPEVAGVYYSYLPSAELVTDSFRLLLDGDGNGLYDCYDREADEHETADGTYTYNETTEEYTFTFTSGTMDGDTMKFKLAVRKFYPVFLRYNEDWAGEFENDYEFKLVLDGYGNAWYRTEDDKAVCQIVGKNNNAVTFVLRGERFAMILDRENGKFERVLDPLGYYSFYDFDTVRLTKRICLGADGDAQIEEYSQEDMAYIPTVIGTYAKIGTAEGVYRFTPQVGEAFEFKIDVIGGYDVYRLKDGSEAKLTCTATSIAAEIKPTLELNGFGDAKYSFYDKEEDRIRTYEGYYKIDVNGNLTFIFVGTNGMVLYTYRMKVNFDDNTFEVLERVDGEL